MVEAIILRAAVSVGLDKVDLPIDAVTIDAEVNIGTMTAVAESAVVMIVVGENDAVLSVSTTTGVAESAVATTVVEETSDDPNTAGVRTDLVGDTHPGMIPKADTPGMIVAVHPIAAAGGMDVGMRDVQSVVGKIATVGVIPIAETVKVGVDQKGDTDATMTAGTTAGTTAVTAGGMIGMTGVVAIVVKVDEAAVMTVSMRTAAAPTVPSTPARNAPATAKSALTTASTSQPYPQIWIQRSLILRFVRSCAAWPRTMRTWWRST